MQLKQRFQELGLVLKRSSALVAESLLGSFGMHSAEKNTQSLECANPVKTQSLAYKKVFPDFDYDYIALGNQLGLPWADYSWGNNTCPSYSMALGEAPYEVWYTLYFDYNDPGLSDHAELRETGDMKKYELVDEFGNCIYSTDQWEHMRKKIVDDKFVQNHFDNLCEQRALDNGG